MFLGFQLLEVKLNSKNCQSFLKLSFCLSHFFVFGNCAVRTGKGRVRRKIAQYHRYLHAFHGITSFEVRGSEIILLMGITLVGSKKVGPRS